MSLRRHLCRFLVCILILLVAAPLRATELTPRTASAFDAYVALTEARIAQDLRRNRFLVIDALPEAARRQAYTQLRQGQVHIQQMHTTDDGRNVAIPGGLSHHWVGVVYIPGASLLDTLALLQDADRYTEIYKPSVRRSRLVSWDENRMNIEEQFYRKTIVTVAVNARFDIHYRFLDSAHLVCESHSTRIAEVEHPGQANESELPVGNDHGYLWRIHSYWHIEEKDGGVYLQVESVALSRSVPLAMEWAVAPFLKSVPRGILSTFLTTTRSAVLARTPKSQAAAPSGH